MTAPQEPKPINVAAIAIVALISIPGVILGGVLAFYIRAIILAAVTTNYDIVIGESSAQYLCDDGWEGSYWSAGAFDSYHKNIAQYGDTVLSLGDFKIRERIFTKTNLSREEWDDFLKRYNCQWIAP